ncbi:DUF6551 family protein [Streptomyces sp. H39-C1]|uniref:DUF6551 family protein n=1 Tax=Streptomyces sp. H39-C1 TaxID=3004355 RepID=UPI0022AFE024|nr:DUF6551 family protein [Streptomyces sp. H39-C1]MCZ4096087.1 hypothetical protein [Streptomyces sp. H39-C1]
MATTKIVRRKQVVRKYYESIRVSQLRVDPNLDAQRMFQPKWAGRLAKIWDREVLMPAIVSRRPDGDFLLDGQHSTKVALDIEGPDFERDCMVYEGLTKQREAKLFLAANRDRRAVRPFENFVVAVTAKEPEAVTINRDVESCGLHVSSGTSKNGVSAIQALKVVHGMRDPEDGLVRKTLTTVLDAWGSDPTSWDGMMLRAVAIVISKNWETIHLPSLALTLKQEPVGRWKDMAILDTVSGGGSQSRSIPLAANIAYEYSTAFAGQHGMAIGPQKRKKKTVAAA